MASVSNNSNSNGKSKRGFAAMKEQGRGDEIRKIAEKGGKSSHRSR